MRARSRGLGTCCGLASGRCIAVVVGACIGVLRVRGVGIGRAAGVSGGLCTVHVMDMLLLLRGGVVEQVLDVPGSGGDGGRGDGGRGVRGHVLGVLSGVVHVCRVRVCA